MLTLEALCLSQFEVLEYLCQLKMYVRLFAHIKRQCFIVIVKYKTNKQKYATLCQIFNIRELQFNKLN